MDDPCYFSWFLPTSKVWVECAVKGPHSTHVSGRAKIHVDDIQTVEHKWNIP